MQSQQSSTGVRLDAEEGHGKVTQLYNRTISRLQTAADKGDTEASQLLAEINP